MGSNTNACAKATCTDACGAVATCTDACGAVATCTDALLSRSSTTPQPLLSRSSAAPQPLLSRSRPATTARWPAQATIARHLLSILGESDMLAVPPEDEEAEGFFDLYSPEQLRRKVRR